jgi:hypothetical protein
MTSVAVVGSSVELAREARVAGGALLSASRVDRMGALLSHWSFVAADVVACPPRCAYMLVIVAAVLAGVAVIFPVASIAHGFVHCG